MFGVFDFANVATVKIGAVRECLLAETSGAAQFLYVQTDLYPQLHGEGRATM